MHISRVVAASAQQLASFYYYYLFIYLFIYLFFLCYQVPAAKFFVFFINGDFVLRIYFHLSHFKIVISFGSSFHCQFGQLLLQMCFAN
jgi:hypothetical protein